MRERRSCCRIDHGEEDLAVFSTSVNRVREFSCDRTFSISHRVRVSVNTLRLLQAEIVFQADCPAILKLLRYHAARRVTTTSVADLVKIDAPGRSSIPP